MRLLYAISILVLFFGATAQSQTLRPGVEYLNQKHFTLKMDGANYLNPFDPSVLVSGEFYIRPKLTFTQEIGWVTKLRFQENGDDVYGWKLREEIRFYPDILYISDKMTGFISFNISYRNLSKKEDYVIGYGCENGGCDYYQNYKIINAKEDRIAFSLRGGYLFSIGDHFVMEWDYGLGTQYRSEREDHLPKVDGKLVSSTRVRNYSTDEWNPYLTMSIKVGYVFK